MPRAAEGKARCSDPRRGTTTMIGIGIFFSVVGLGYLCWAPFDLIVYALPAVVGVTAGFTAYHSGAGVLGAIIVAPNAALASKSARTEGGAPRSGRGCHSDQHLAENYIIAAKGVRRRMAEPMKDTRHDTYGP